MSTQTPYSFLRKPLVAGILVFFAVLLLTQFITYQRYLLFKNSRAKELNSVASLAKEKLQSVLINSVTATNTLSFIVKEYGVPEDFEKVAAEILESNNFVDVLQLVEGDEITKVYPMQGNESVIGYKILKDTLRNKEAFKAIEKKELFFAGPFNLRQGGVAIVGRLPIFKNNKYWGFAVAITKLSTFIKAAQIDTADNPDYLFQLSKINPDTGVEEFFLPNESLFKGIHSVAINVPNGDWNLYVLPKNSQTFISPIPFSILGFILSITAGLFAWFITKQPYELKKLVDEQTLALSTSEENYRNTIERVSDAFIALDKNWNYTFVNSKAGELHERDPQSLLGKNVWKEFPDVVHEPFYDALMKAMNSQEPQMVELYYSKVDKWFEDYMYPSPNGITVYYRDVTEQRRINEEVARERTLSESILKSLPGIFYLYNSEGKFIRWNKNFETVSGYSSEEISTMHPLDFFDKDEKVLLEQKIASVFENGSDEVEAHFVTKQGERVLFFFNGYALELNGEKCLIGIGIDLTEKEKAQVIIKESEEKYKYLFHNNPGLIIIWDLETMEILEVNNTALSEYGYTRDEMMHLNVVELRPQEDQHKIFEFADQMLQSNETKRRRIWRHLKKTGEVMYMDITSHRIEYNNRKAILAIAKNVTEQLHIEEQLRKSHENIRLLNDHLQTVREEERTAIAREIHDELGQQLTCLKMDASWLNKKFDTKETETKDRLNGMIDMIDNTVKTVRRISSELRPGILDDLGLVAAIEWQSREFAKHANIATEFKTEIMDAPVSKKVATGVFRVFQEALTNVARHSKATILETLVTVNNNMLTLQVHDNGVGFDMEHVKQKNTLGLLGMKERVLMFGGEIDFESSTDKGTTITIKAPLIVNA